MAAKFPYQSNFVYCGNNPINVIDPNGEDEYEFDGNGNLKWIKESEFDSFHKIDKNGHRTGEDLSFDKKVVSDRFDLGKKHVSSYLRIDNANDADDIFSFLSENVESEGGEFTNSIVQDKYGNIFNLIGADQDAQKGESYSLSNLLHCDDYTVCENTHNHFAGKASPSPDDVVYAKKYPDILFMIRTAGNFCTSYDKDTKPDYDMGTRDVIFYIKEVEIK